MSLLCALVANMEESEMEGSITTNQKKTTLLLPAEIRVTVFGVYRSSSSPNSTEVGGSWRITLHYQKHIGDFNSNIHYRGPLCWHTYEHSPKYFSCNCH